MNRTRQLHLKKPGYAMTLVLLAVVILLAAGVGLLSLGLNSRIFAIRTASGITARCAADSGLTKAVFEMNEKLKAKSLGDDASLPREIDATLANCEATYSYKIVSNSLKSGREWTITSVGESGQAEKTVYATVGLKGLFDSAILVKNRMSLMPNTLVAGYNSADLTDNDNDVKIGTTSIESDRIPIGPGTVIEGDVFCGVGGDPQSVIGPGGTIKGNKFALTEEIDFPVITPPPLPDMGTGLSTEGSTIIIGPKENGKYQNISLLKGGSNPGVLQISGGDVVLHITGDIDVRQGCEIVVMANATLTLYVDGDIHADNSLGLNNKAGNVKDLKLYGTGVNQVFQIKAKSKVFGAVYAPEAEITLYPSSEIYGAIVGKSIQFKSGCNFYYDEALRDVSVDDEGVRFVVKHWRE